MDYAVVSIAGHQHQVKVNDLISVEGTTGKAGDKIIIDQVLFIKQNGKGSLGTPLVKNAKVEAEIIDHFRDKKVRVAKFRAKSRYRKVHGQRQHKIKLKILKISLK